MIEILLEAERSLTAGRLDHAEGLYRQAIAADGRNSIAVVGLARVALDRGEDLAARELARQALAIDPENAAAQRLVARLDEVLGVTESAADPPARSPAGASDEGSRRAGILRRLFRRS